MTGGLQIRFRGEPVADHSGELSHLNVLQAKLSIEPRLRRFLLGWGEPGPGFWRKDLLFLEASVAAQRIVELLDGATRRLRVAGLERGKQTAEKSVELSMFGDQAIGRCAGRRQEMLLVPLGGRKGGSKACARLIARILS